MGHNILVQRRGKGGKQFRATITGKLGDASYPTFPIGETFVGTVAAILHERGRSAPLARVIFNGGPPIYLPAVKKMIVGSKIMLGPDAEPSLGNILPIGKIPEGTTVCNIEKTFGDGGKFVRASGGSALVFSQTPNGAVVKFPSKKMAMVQGNCRATIGEVAGGGRTEKPFLRAGAKYHLMRARSRHYPTVRGIAMASVNHPFGGGRHQHPGKSTSTSRNAPPGRKVGHIAPRQTGRSRKPRETGVVDR